MAFALVFVAVGILVVLGAVWIAARQIDDDLREETALVRAAEADEFAGCPATYRLACGCRVDTGPSEPRLALGGKWPCSTGEHGLGITFHAPPA